MILLDQLITLSAPHLVGVHPELAKRVQAYMTTAYRQNLFFAPFMGLRTWVQQDTIWSIGRTVPGTKVTNAKGGQSSHNFGLAVDLVEDGDPNNAGIQWSWSKNLDYLQLGSLAAMSGLEWGGFWKSFKDYPHVTLTLGISMSQAQDLYHVGGIPAVWAELDKRLASNVPLSSGW